MRYVAHNTAAWNDVFETLHRIRYYHGRSAPNGAACDGVDADQPGQQESHVVYDWAHITSPTFVFGGADDFLAGRPLFFRPA
jgi:hypothetical protein